MTYIAKPTLLIAEKIRSIVLARAQSAEEMTIFLCGAGDGPEKKVRDDMKLLLNQKKSKYKYSVHYPDDLFFDLIRGHAGKNLLDLENMLAESVTSTVILLHSAGAFTELGAFANHPVLSNKLIVVVNSKYEKDKSFINLGPIQHLKKNTKSAVLYDSFKDLNELANLITPEVRKMKGAPGVNQTLANPIYAFEYMYILVYILGPIPKKVLTKIASLLETPQEYQKLWVFAETALTLLINRGLLKSKNHELSTDSHVLFEDDAEISFFYRYRLNVSSLRAEAMNFTLRKGSGWRV